MRVILTLLLATFLCTRGSAQTTVNYQANDADFPNPERGFYHYTETRSENYTPLDVAQLVALRGSTTSSGANHSVVSSLVFRYFFLGDFTGGPISQTYLDAIADDFSAVRAAGLKIIPRFAYTDEITTGDCGSFICPPYGDAPKDVVLQHITQVGPVLRANADVIAAVQMGFIGTWGENYYTDHFGDASQQGKLFDENWQDRIEVLNALLDEAPASRAVQVRYPQMKQRTIYGVNTPTTSPALTEAQAYAGTDEARIGFHNDCLLASATDFGTYQDYGNSTSGSQSDTANLKPYFAADSRFVPVGGETCSDAEYDPTNNCVAAGGIGDFELRRMHYSYLNVDFNHDVNNDWETGGCMDAIKRELGYRFELQSGTFPDELAPGSGADFSFTVINLGYAAPYNERPAEMILRNTVSGEVWRAPLAADPRRWDRESTEHTSTAPLCIPADMPLGTYDLLLNLPAPEPSIYERPEYSIRLANRVSGADVWEAATGYNSLGHQVTVVANGTTACAGGTEFENLLAALPVEFTSVTARASNKAIELNWATAREVDNDHFVVERRKASNSFLAIAKITPNALGRYRLTDTEVVAGSTYFYRIRQVDTDGSSRVSETVGASLTEAAALRIFPNPSTGLVSINRPDGLLRVYDQAGRAIPVVRRGHQVDFGGLPTGIYIVELLLAEGVERGRVVLR